ncbi:MAG: sugar nucleotide-binding protein [Alphaproteobacteria bacterium]|nr:sugar nucleotide-binding protein [Alphaproteobacteria bacterium]
MARCLVIGVDSALGAPLFRRIEGEGHPVFGTTRRTGPRSQNSFFLDLSLPPENWPSFPQIETAWLMAGWTLQADCKADPSGAHLVNVERLLQLARILAQSGARLIFPSTSLVFDGQSPAPGPDTPTSPQGAYASQKTEVERALLELPGQSCAILRLGKVLTPDLPLLDSWKAALLADQPIEPFADLFIAPLDQASAVEALFRLGMCKKTGIFQFCAHDQISYADIAMRLTRLLGKDPSLVKPVLQREKMKDSPPPAPFATLETGGTERVLDMKAPSALDVVDSVLCSFLKMD